MGFTQSAADPCIFVKGVGDNLIMMAIYVDDFIVAAASNDLADEVAKQLFDKFRVKDLGPLTYCLGMQLTYAPDRNKLILSQTKHIEDMIDTFNLNDMSPPGVPMAPDIVLSSEQCPISQPDKDAMKKYPYKSLLGTLMHIMISTRPDVSFAVITLSQYASNPALKHWEALCKVARYLNKTKHLGIAYHKSTDAVPSVPELVGYTDADWAGFDHDSRRSYTGYIFKLAGGPICWKTKKQSAIAMSSTEAEYYSMGAATTQAVSSRSDMDEMHFPQPNATQIHQDNQSAIALSRNPVFHARTKHIELRHHFIRHLVAQGIVMFTYIPTKEQ
jgi:hypothetical protein